MQDMAFISQCVSDQGLELAVDRQGCLWKKARQEQEEWEIYHFNQEYHGYYPACRFTAVAWTKGGFLAVGMSIADAQAGNMPAASMPSAAMPVDMPMDMPTGMPIGGTERTVAYSSLRGGVWQPENLVAQTPEGPVIPVQPVYDICQDEVSGQVFLLGGKGQVITLTGCPKCVKISFFTGQDIQTGSVEGEYLKLLLADGTGTKIHLHAAMQLHLSKEAAAEKHRQGGIYVYVGDFEEADRQEQKKPGEPKGLGVSEMTEGSAAGDGPIRIYRCPLPELAGFLRNCDKEQILLFCCPNGFRAEAAAKSARAQGFREAYYTEKR